jgi:hypothetical protein
LCTWLLIFVTLLSAVGMIVSSVYLDSATWADFTTSASGFVAGAVFIGSGLILLALLAVGTRLITWIARGTWRQGGQEEKRTQRTQPI